MSDRKWILNILDKWKTLFLHKRFSSRLPSSGMSVVLESVSGGVDGVHNADEVVWEYRRGDKPKATDIGGL